MQGKWVIDVCRTCGKQAKHPFCEHRRSERWYETVVVRGVWHPTTWRVRVEQVPCPTCDAEAGARCVSSSGKLSQPHKTRVSLHGRSLAAA